MLPVHKQRKNVRDRLTKAEGHIRGIIKMIDEEIKAETKLYDVKINSLELEKEYLQKQLLPR